MERRFVLRTFGIAFALFVLLTMPPPFAAGPEEGVKRIATPVEPPKSESPAAPKPPEFKAFELLRATEDAIRPPEPAKYREWAGYLLSQGERALAVKLADKPAKSPADALTLAKDLVRRAQYESAEPLVQALLRKQPDSVEVQLLGAACELGLGRPELAQRPLFMLQRARDPKDPDLAELAELVGRLCTMMQAGRLPGVEHNPWGVAFLPKGSAEASKKLSEEEAKKLPAKASALLGRWLAVAPMQPNLWALLGQILYVRGEPEDSLECFRRAKGLGYSVPLVTAYLQSLERAEADRRAAALKQMSNPTDKPPAANTTTDTADTPVAVTESSARAMGAFAVGGLIVGLLLGQMFRRRG